MTYHDHTPRHDGWNPARQRAFLEQLAASGLVRSACAEVEMSREAAYKLRHRREGAAFALGWDAALLLARCQLADTLMERAIDGQTDILTRDDDAGERRRHRHDNRLAMSVLGRLDRFADGASVAATDALLIAGDWEAFLDLIDDGHGGAGAALFLAARRPVDPQNDANGPCQLCGSDTEQDDESDEEFVEEEAASLADLVAGEFIVRDEAGLRDWLTIWRDEAGNWMTNFPPPEDYEGYEHGTFGIDDHYYRELTVPEEFCVDDRTDSLIDDQIEIARRLHAKAFPQLANAPVEDRTEELMA